MNVGRPLKFQSVEELEKKIEEYFNSCLKPALNPETGEQEKDLNGNPIYEQFKPFTVSGLAVYLDTSRKYLIEYQERDQFRNTIMRAKQKIEAYTESALFNRDSTNGAKFVLINGYGWADVREINTNPQQLPQLSQSDVQQITAGSVSLIADMLAQLVTVMQPAKQPAEIPGNYQVEKTETPKP